MRCWSRWSAYDYKLGGGVKLVVVRVCLLDGTALEILELWLDDKGWEI